jgi:glycosyltransferase involved in cell wall biosynthesis
MLKIHYHSECSFFAGCEAMLAVFFNSDSLRRNYDISFSYKQSNDYTQGFRQRVHKNLSTFPLNFVDLTDYSKLPSCLPLLTRKIIMAFLRAVFKLPNLAFQVFVLQKLLKKVKPDVLHINNGGYPAAQSALAAAIAGKISGVPKVIMVVNNMAIDYKHYSRWIDYPLDQIVVACVNVFITGSTQASHKLKSVLRLPSEQVKTIHNGIDLRPQTCSINKTRERLGLSDFNGTIFGVVALLIERKGHQVLLDAVLGLVNSNLLDENLFKIVIEGHGPLRKKLVEYVINNQLEKYVIFVGDELNITNFISAIDVLILPSVKDEDLPNVISEAMALGKPVVSTKIAGIPEQIIHGKTGLLVDPGSAIQLALATYHLTINSAMRKMFALNSVNRFNSHFSSQMAISRYSDLYAKPVSN